MTSKRKDAAQATGPAAEADLSTRALRRGLLMHFFANLCLTSDANLRLSELGFGRLHHRILFFAANAPGITVGELLGALRVTHQNVRAPMKHLLDSGHLLARIGQKDRRHKRLYASAKGRNLVDAISKRQMERIERAYRAAGPEAVRGFFLVHQHLVDPSDLDWMEQLWADRADG
jgi:DNA-binding MarR family transcriptional regulator